MGDPARVLVLFAHPAFHNSRVNRRLVQAIEGVEGITLHDLDEHYPSFHIDVAREQELLRRHDLIVFQHPFYWYSSPAILKGWQDLVLEHGFAYGEGGNALRGKRCLSAITTGGPKEAYCPQGANRFSILELLAPFQQTAALCGMDYLPPLVVFGTHRLREAADLDPHADDYRSLLVVPISNRLGLGSVLGYLIAGVLIGPFGLHVVGREGQDVMHFAEFGVVMMLFLVGLELQPSLLWRLRLPILGLGGLQVLVTALAIALVGALLGLSPPVALAVGLIKTDAGQSSFSVLLFQDIAAIPILAFLPLLASKAPEALQTGSHAPAAGAPLQQAPQVIGIVLAMIVGGRFLMRPVFRVIAATKLREVFTATALLLVIGIALAMQQVGLSPALGTFVAGVVLADNEYRHELKGDIAPFKGLLLGLFFLTVGASIDFQLLQRSPVLVLALVLGLALVKFLVLLALGRVFRLGSGDNLLFALALAQGGEFCFVLFSFATTSKVLPQELSALLVVALSMVVTPLMLMAHERWIQPLLLARAPQREPDSIDNGDTQVIIAGFGRFGQIVGRLLLANRCRLTVLDHSPTQIDLLRHFGLTVF
ncbi:NAD(P)H-dependent oxidoreductase [Cyanobium sp. Morenito 9A2]|uniref:NAD(P)H-dependent oxidoreductase n=1 Tax=Cyanobium sp. Morenito 9A2 TaxID=2823718 RepID=UPI0020CC8C54|nr:NAD(P)H-dependent oxidoreductase [Cyanobium sp. Morenito 9A2]MCP9850378.1 cation:proton antiporter [Cyanobium sp. Morenito 9A2]